MGDYIDRQAAIDLLNKLADGYSYIELPTEDAINYFKAIPSADVAPVRRGYWIGGEIGNCSVCGHRGCASDIWTGCWAKGKTFCPACGALLDDEYWDEEEDDNAE